MLTKSPAKPAPPHAVKPTGSPEERMRATIGEVVAVGPRFLHGEIDADAMAAAMVGAVKRYAEGEPAGGRAAPRSREAAELHQVIEELETCGSGYLAGRCDAACVARTMTFMVEEFGPS
ncbi:MAG: hypothetical protein OZ921_14655 [Sorangiineae bacterium]|nr:hypothetical protein [Polyangiaceae bacterium]MEB2323749.1 hypothetical protein [Sorangiineae bacterium]